MQDHEGMIRLKIEQHSQLGTQTAGPVADHVHILINVHLMVLDPILA